MNFGVTSLAAPEGGIVKCREVILHRLQRIWWKVGRIPFIARNGALLVGISLDQTRIDGKAFAAHKPFIKAAPHHLLEHAPKKIALSKTAMTIA